MRTGNQSGDDADPRAKQNPAGHDGNDTHVNQRSLDRHAGPGAEQREQREDRGDGQQLFWRVRRLVQKLAEQANADKEKQANQH